MKTRLLTFSLTLLVFGILPGGALAETRRIFLIGNSVTDAVGYTTFQQVAQSRGYTHIWGRHVILGSPLEYIWSNPNSGFETAPFGHYPNALPNYNWDAITLQTYSRGMASDLTAYENFMNLAREREYNRDNTEFFVYARWPRKDDGDFDTYWQRTSDGSTALSATRDYFETFTVQLRERNPGVSIRMIPVGHVFFELNQRMQAGLVPGFSHVYDFYTDNVHLTPAGSYVVASTFFSTIYKDDPRGLPLAGSGLTQEQADIFQEVIWEVVARTPLAGVGALEGIVISTDRIPRASVNRAFNFNLRALFGVEPYTWSAEGNLPPGLTLSSSGNLSGTPTADGIFPFTLTVVDAENETTSVEIAWLVTENTIPQITTASLPAGFQGTPYWHTLSAHLGDPPLRWVVSGGTLPPGLKLTTDGQIQGTPSTQGTFNFTIKVEDDDFPADTDTRAYTVVMGAPEANTVTVFRTRETILVDGNLSESAWNLSRGIQTPAFGSTSASASWGALWDTAYLYLGFEVEDATAFSGNMPLFDNDSIEIFIDGNHDREFVFNIDDRHFVINREGVAEEIFGRGDGWLVGLQSSPEGYTIEVAIPWNNLERTPYPGMGVGFDVVVNDDVDGSGRSAALSWEGVDLESPSPNGFGNLLLSPTLVGEQGADVLLAYEPFSGPEGFLHTTGVPLGWSEHGWVVQNNYMTLPGYALTEVNLPRYGNHREGGELLVQGMRATGGAGSRNAGRAFDVNGAFASFRNNDRIGVANTTLWASWLIRADSAGAHSRVAFSAPGITWNPDGRQITVFQNGGTWHLQLAGGDAINTGISIEPGVPYLMVVRIDFATSGSEVSLYINPEQLGGQPPASPSVSATANSLLGFSRLHWYPGSGTGNGTLDEIRVGASYAAVTPLMDYAPIIDEAPEGTSVDLGDSVELSVAAFSRTPISYQWYRNNSPLPGATSATLQLPSVAQADLGSYRVRLQNRMGSTMSEPVTLALIPEPEPDPMLTPGYAAWADLWAFATDEDSLPGADPMGIGRTNLEAYVFGWNPLGDSFVPTAYGVSVDGTSTVFEFSPIRMDPDLTLRVVISCDLVEWVEPPAGSQVSTESIGNGFGTVTLALPVGALPCGAVFARLELSAD